MKAVVKKWGNSAAVRLPAAIMEAANLELDQELEIREEDGVITIKPLMDECASLEALVAAMTEENMPEDMSFEPSIGEEFDL
ncbi:AbrB/MazE/SpoVT family DNA-binding domain-containing protein [Hellea balneolensis]|uniref:AbrB/MazE/SpoVT family DNA-binding domain-containing protein n=1 Tax=Hellea balneolensis TaxID=287478 RepID=UPI00040BF065|nr:AbrB/MazE/SpoVT family DNA-binding domain-containing protein [Hellea balneolensis]